MADDEKTRWAIDVMTAWTLADGDPDFVRERLDSYAAEADVIQGLLTGLMNLSALLLSGMEVCTGKDPQAILQAIASTVARQGQAP